MVIATRDGVIIYADSLTQEQKEQAWVKVLSVFIQAHPEVLNIDRQDAVDDRSSHM